MRNLMERVRPSSHLPSYQLQDKAFWSLCDAVSLGSSQCCGLLVSIQMQRTAELSCLPIILGGDQAFSGRIVSNASVHILKHYIEDVKVCFLVRKSFCDSYKNMTQGPEHLSILLEFLLQFFHNSSPRQIIQVLQNSLNSFKILITKHRGDFDGSWRHDSLIKCPYCSYRGPKFNYGHTFNTSFHLQSRGNTVFLISWNACTHMHTRTPRSTNPFTQAKFFLRNR